MKPRSRSTKGKSNLLYQWAALLLGLISPILLYFSIQAENHSLSVVFFVLCSVAMALTAWKS